MVRSFLAGATLLLVIAYLYHPATAFPFLDGWDDPEYVTANPKIRSLAFANLIRIFTSFDMGNYAPIQILSYAVEYQIWGIHPFGFRAVNIGLHFLNAILVFIIVRRICSRDIIALVVALIFSVHPLQVEAVAWIAQRKTLLATFFMLLSFLYFMRYREGERSFDHNVASLCYVLALLAKVSVIVLPAYMLAYDLLVHGQLVRKRLVHDYFFVGLVSVVMVAVTLVAQGVGVGVRPSHYGQGIIQSSSVPPTIWGYYVRSFFWPARLSALYDENVILQAVVWKAFLTIAGLAIVVFILVRLKNGRSRKQWFWLAWFFIGLLPVSQIVPMVTAMNDRYVYFPLIGLAAFAVTAIYDGRFSGTPRSGLVWTVVASLVMFPAVGAYGWAAKARLPVWKDTYALWSDAIAKYPQQAKAHNNLGAHFEQQGKLAQAEREYKTALDIDPEMFVARYNLGKVYGQRGRLEEAAAEFQKAADILPADPTIHYFLGMAYKMGGHPALAIQEFQRDLHITPGKLTSIKELVDLYVEGEQYGEAAALITETRERHRGQPRVEGFLRDMERKINVGERRNGT
jgi:Flp pilus assembly protein TadD